MTSAFPAAAVPGPDDVPPEEQHDTQQPDPFGDPTDAEGGKGEHADPDASGDRPKNDPRGE
jgi:hypothetical protein